jgi:hypothetical protein
LGYYALHDLQDKDRDSIQRPVLQLLQEAKDGKVEGWRQDEVGPAQWRAKAILYLSSLLELPAVFLQYFENINLIAEYIVL